MQAEPKISIIIATYNAGRSLQPCLDSAAGQIYANKEIIVIDGASTDNTCDIIRSNSHRLHYWESAPDRGVYHAWNKGLLHASGEWIHFVGADDCYAAPDVLERLAPALKLASGRMGLVYGRLARVTPTGEILEIWGDVWERSRELLQGKMSIPHGAAFHHRSLFAESGSFNESFKICGDYELMLRALKGREAYFMEDIVVIAQGCHGMSSLPETAFQRNAEMVRARQLNGSAAYPLVALPLAAQNLIYGAAYRFLGRAGAFFVQNAYRKITGRQKTPIPRKRVERHGGES